MTRNRIIGIAFIVLALVGFSYYGATNFNQVAAVQSND